MKLKNLFSYGWLISIMLFSMSNRAAITDVAKTTVYINPDLFTLGDILTVTNKGKDIGWFQVSRKTSATDQSSSIALENMDKPSKRIYLWGPDGRIGQIFRGTNRIACYACTGSGAKDPNEGLPCENELDKNRCIACTRLVPCKDVLSMVKIHAEGGETRANEPPAGFAEEKRPGTSYEGESVYKRLDIVKPAS